MRNGTNGNRHKKNRSRRKLAIGAMAVALAVVSSLSTTTTPAAATAPCEMTPDNFQNILSHLAIPSTAGWIASDGFSSVPLDGNRTLTIGQDTFYGRANVNTMLSGSMRRNSFLIYDERVPGCFTVQAGTGDGGAMPTGGDPAKTWYWPGSPTRYGNTITIVASRMKWVDNPGSWDFALEGTEAKTYYWDGGNGFYLMSTRSLLYTNANPSGRLLGFNYAKAIGDWVYLTASDLRPNQWGHDVYLARVPVSEWFAATGSPLTNIQFLTLDSTWIRNAPYHSLKRIIEGSGESSVSIEHTGNEMHLIYKQYSLMGERLYDAHAATPEGVWTQTPIAEAPPRRGVISYIANVQSWGAKGLNRKVTVNQNNGEDLGWGNLYVMNRYRPTLTDVVLPERIKVHTGLAGGSTAIGNLTAIGSYYPGSVTAYPCDQARPLASTNNYGPQQITPNFVAVKTDANGDFCVDSSTPAHFVFDATGGAGNSAAGTPIRLLDTRNSKTPAAAGSVTRVRTTQAPGTTILGNLTVTQPNGQGHTRVWNCEGNIPYASTNNYTDGQTTPNFTATTTDANGDFCIYTSNTTHLVFDYAGAVSNATLDQPARLLDTRGAGSPAAAGSVTRVRTTQAPGTTILGNLTVTQPNGQGHTRVWNCEGNIPYASTNNYTDGQTTPNFTATTTDANGDFCIYTSNTTHLVFDYAGTSPQIQAQPPRRTTDTRQ